jgi:hypothetical protein
MFALVALTLLAGVKEDLAEATRLLKSAQEEAAVQVLTRALDRGGLQPSQRSQLYLLLGIARVNLRDEEGAALAFTHGAEADADAKLPPKIAPPRARELFEAAKAEVARKASLPPVPEPKAEPAPPPPQAVVAPAPVSPPPAVETAPKTGVGRWVGIGLGIVGAAVGGTGGYFLANGSSLRAQSVMEPNAVMSAQLFDRAQTSWTLGLSLLGVGIALLIGGVLTALLS